MQHPASFPTSRRWKDRRSADRRAGQTRDRSRASRRAHPRPQRGSAFPGRPTCTSSAHSSARTRHKGDTGDSARQVTTAHCDTHTALAPQPGGSHGPRHTRSSDFLTRFQPPSWSPLAEADRFAHASTRPCGPPRQHPDTHASRQASPPVGFMVAAVLRQPRPRPRPRREFTLTNRPALLLVSSLNPEALERDTW